MARGVEPVVTIDGRVWLSGKVRRVHVHQHQYEYPFPVADGGEPTVVTRS